MVSHRYREYGKGGSSKVGKGEGLESKHVGAEGGLPRKGKKYLVNTCTVACWLKNVILLLSYRPSLR